MIPSILADQIRTTVVDYLRTTFNLSDKALEAALFEFLEGDDGLFRGPFIDLRLPYRKAEANAVIPLEIAPPFTPYKHQLQAFQRLSSADQEPRHTLVTTGTGSGKTECFLYPILDHCYRHRDQQGIKAIVLYPMNALASDQAARFAKEIWHDPRLKGHVRAGLYVGGEGSHGIADEKHLVDQREQHRMSPPDILLTNYRMLDFLLLRPEDTKLWRFNLPGTLRYLVVDELHTFDGAQGSDVACLIRRLRARLGQAEGDLTFVGTSATIGSRPEDAHELVRFASDIFSADFDASSLVGESRLPIEQFLPIKFGPAEARDTERYPGPEDAEPLDPEGVLPKIWLNVQQDLWLGARDLDPVALGERLRSHTFLRSLLYALGGRTRPWEELEAELAQLDTQFADLKPHQRWPAVLSFLALVACARSEDDRPLLHSHVQVWLRELRRLVRRVGDAPRSPESGDEGDGEVSETIAEPKKTPESGSPSPVSGEGVGGRGPGGLFAWADALPDDRLFLPMVYCRDCGASGFGARELEATPRLDSNPGNIGEAYLKHTQYARFLTLREHAEGALFNTFLCPRCNRLSPKEECLCKHPKCVPITSHDLMDRVEGKAPRFNARCPECDSNGALSMLGSRSASLSSVALSQIFLSAYTQLALPGHDDAPKLLAFTDSVQDASHRAGFFAARTYRFNLRSAIADTLQSATEPVLLSDLGDAVVKHWAGKMAPRQLVATFWPPDLRGLDTYQHFVAKKGAGKHDKLRRQLAERLSWEACAELGLNVHVGRTLERTGCAAVFAAPEALEQAAIALRENLCETDLMRWTEATVPDVAAFEHFLRGLVWRLRHRGGVLHPLLSAYLEGGGNEYLLRGKSPLLPPFGRNVALPRFLTEKGGPKTFDPFSSTPRLGNWHRDWAVRALGLGESNPRINDLYRLALEQLVQREVLSLLDVKHHPVWGLRREALRVTADLTLLVCERCGARVTVPANGAEPHGALGRQCMSYRCPGALGEQAPGKASYYRGVYLSGRVRRIFSQEHTGLLERAAREDLEERFRDASDPDAPNVLVATPTLEMGIDIGDLSAAMLCSIPPTTASYLQRIGRAGRKSGNALTLTLVLSRPHDLFFHAQPGEMLAGDVTPPGCFLDAPEMLKRQLAAYAMDCWAREQSAVSHIPPQISFCLGQGRAKLLDPILRSIKENTEGVVSGFLRLFGDVISPASEAILRQFATAELAASFEEAFGAVESERKELRAELKKLKDREQELAKSSEVLADLTDDKKEVDDNIWAIKRVLSELDHKYPLNVLTDEGVLPNYAFPEPGVVLKSVVRERSTHKHNDDDKSTHYKSFEYHRPASSAIRELAPFNTFYADGRKVKITEIDLGSKKQSLAERWRFCPGCHHMERVLTAESTAATCCPTCNDGNWSDTGQVRDVVHFRRSRSFSDLMNVVATDISDERERVSYHTKNLIDIEPEEHSQAYVLADLPFGFQHHHDVTLREVNFGLPAHLGDALRVGGETVHERGFEVCVDCGRVRDPFAKGRGAGIHHAPACRYRNENVADKNATVFLYRQVRSEALRILLPVVSQDVEREVASLKAALQLGLTRKMRGNPGHLLFKETSEPLEPGGKARRHYLVLYDGVPGGTGTLAGLGRPEEFEKVLKLALRAITSCSCQSEGGCYRCVYAYQSQYELPNISRKVAQQRLSEILSAWPDLEMVPSLSEVTLDSRIESELEARFLAVLEQTANERNWGWGTKQFAGKESNLLTFNPEQGGKTWQLDRQVDLGAAQGVLTPTRPDFLLTNLDDPHTRPIAVYLDGLAYHALPRQPRARIWDDLVKRQGLIESGKTWVWSIGWKDLDDFQTSIIKRRDAVLFNVDVAANLRSPKMLDRTRTQAAFHSNPLAALLTYLEQPEPTRWAETVKAHVLTTIVGKTAQAEAVEALHDTLLKAPARLDLPKTLGGAQESFAWLHSEPWGATLLDVDLADVVGGAADRYRITMRLFDEHEGRRDEEFEASWRNFLYTWCLVQFHERVEVTSSERLAVDAEGDGDFVRVESPKAQGADAFFEVDEALEEALQDTPEALRALVRACAARALERPDIGEELFVGRRAAGQLELMWPSLRVAVATHEQEDGRSAALAAGWTVFDETVSCETLAEALRLEVEALR